MEMIGDGICMIDAGDTYDAHNQDKPILIYISYMIFLVLQPTY